ncbi:MAG: metallophosphoesterase [Muribaculaceae bacterium]|nr:metallophosphoesterase [Muribaculaceae bacterium]
MRLPILWTIILIIIQVCIDIYLFRIAWKRTRRLRWPRLQLWTSAAMLVYILVTVSLPRRGGSDSMLAVIMWLLFGYLTVYVSKLSFILWDLIASIPMLWHHRRMKWLSWIGAGTAILIFTGMWWGALINRYRIDVKEITIEVDNLPDQFDRYRIVQFSDFHVGTYGSDTTFVSRAVDRINALHPDAVMFTGDIVNRRSEELRPFVEPLARITAPDGTYSILGNHDYGDYSEWPSPKAKADNMELMYSLQRQMGWKLLLNASDTIYRGNDSIIVIGVENVGDPPFPVYGDLTKAYPNIDDKSVKILLTHNPYHWVADIAPDSTAKIDLTLSGHTHAMQIEAAGISPAAMRYETWGGLYNSPDNRRPLYVNIGIGTVGIPMRLGATPELTVITLRRKS